MHRLALGRDHSLGLEYTVGSLLSRCLISVLDNFDFSCVNAHLLHFLHKDLRNLISDSHVNLLVLARAKHTLGVNKNHDRVLFLMRGTADSHDL